MADPLPDRSGSFIAPQLQYDSVTHARPQGGVFRRTPSPSHPARIPQTHDIWARQKGASYLFLLFSFAFTEMGRALSPFLLSTEIPPVLQLLSVYDIWYLHGIFTDNAQITHR